MNYLKTHIFYIALIAVVMIAGRVWMQEHDARVIAESQAKAAEVNSKQLQASIDDLKKSISDNDAKTAATISILQHALATVTTPQQAIAAIPSVSNIPLNTRVAVDNPSQVSVDALPLYQELNECKQDAVKLNSCQNDLTTEKKIADDQTVQLADKDTEIKALKKKRPFIKRMESYLKVVAVGVGIGALLAGGHL